MVCPSWGKVLRKKSLFVGSDIGLLYKAGFLLIDCFFPSNCCSFHCNESFVIGIMTLASVSHKVSQVSLKKECEAVGIQIKIIQPCISTKQYLMHVPCLLQCPSIEMGIFNGSFNGMYNSLVSYTLPHLCQLTEHKG